MMVTKHIYLKLLRGNNLVEIICLYASNCFYIIGDTRALSLRLFSEIASVYLSQEQYNITDTHVDITQLHRNISEKLLPQ